MPHVDTIKTLTDRDGDIIMSDTALLPLSAFKDKFNFDWFSFDGKITAPKSPTYSPASPYSTRKLSISTASPTSYFTASPLTTETPSRNALDLENTTPLKVIYPAPPAKPLRWVWVCHLCHSRYPLSVTRRCLVDGHYYCSGNSQTQRNVKKRRKNQSCTSEFDYVAWKEWGQWKRKTLALQALANGKEDAKLIGCEGCNSPSQCRYDKRKPVETIKFDDYIEEDDLIVDAVEVVPSDKAAPVLGSTSLFTEERSEKGKKSAVKKTLKVDPNALSPSSNQKSSKRHRFYSNFAGNLSSRELSPTSESPVPLNQGKFNPTLPSVIRASTSGDGDLKAIETTLKGVLGQQIQGSSHENDPQSAAKVKRRTNSKVSDPHFEATTDDIQNGSRLGNESTGLYRTASQQSLLTDFFRQTRVPSSGDPIKRDAARPASEDDILAFLQSKPSHRLEELNSRIKSYHSVQEGGAQNFEDIILSPTKTSSKESLAPTRLEKSSSDQAEVTLADAVGESGRAGIGFVFPSFVFGRK